MKKRFFNSVILSSLLVSCMILGTACSSNSSDSSESTDSTKSPRPSLTDYVLDTYMPVPEEDDAVVVIPETSIPKPYVNVLIQINKAIDEYSDDSFESLMDNDGYVGIAETLAYMETEDAHSVICFALNDIDGNGVEELIIVRRLDENADNGYFQAGVDVGYEVMAIYGLDGDNAVLIAGAWSRNSWYINSEGYLINEGSSGASSYVMSVYSLDGVNLVPTCSMYTEFDANTGDILVYRTVNGGEPELLAAGDYEVEMDTFKTMNDTYLSKLMNLNILPTNTPLA